jgi:hypothetical protein
MGGSCGCCSCIREVEREFYVYTILSADQTIEHWELAVEAGESILWDSLSVAMEEIASDTMDEYGKSLERAEQIILSALDDQFNIKKEERESILEKAQIVQEKLANEAKSFSDMQSDILGNSDLMEHGRKND